jgi:2-hydroxy-3-keto-5-methylthiopentenyl-1-phosphate phosphatase
MPEKPRAFILDFDGTITSRDTIGVLANCGTEWQAKRGVDMRGCWGEIVREYGRDFEDHVWRYQPEEISRRTLDEEISYQRGLKDVEERSFGRVSESGLFEGMGKQIWEDAGRQAVRTGDVAVRKGFKEFVERIKGRRDIWGVVSVNFSGSFVRGVVDASAGPEIGNVEILANNPDERGFLFGPDRDSGRVVATSDAKSAVMKALLLSWSEKGSLDTLRPIYVGDSGTDIECLMEPGVVGVVMSEDGKSSLMQTMKRIGIAVVPIGEYYEEESRKKKVYSARDFDDILHSRLLMQKLPIE